ncbi:MAG: hypothetical protein ACPGNT_10485, partial [Rhodospirillales bacterium]
GADACVGVAKATVNPGGPAVIRRNEERRAAAKAKVEAEIDRVIEVMPGIIAQLRKLSPYWDGDKPRENPEQAFAPAYA